MRGIAGSPRPGTVSRRQRPRRLVAVAIAAVALLGGACGGDDGASGDGRLTVVTTTTQLADFAARIGGDRVEVVSLAKPGVDLHDFDPGPAELERLRGADLVVRNGLGLDPWLDDALTSSETKATVVDASSGITPREGEEHAEDEHADEKHTDEKPGAEAGKEAGKEAGTEAGKDDHDHEHGAVDPHIWFDPRNAVQMVTTMADAFAAADPDGADAYRSAQTAYTKELEQLDADIEASVATLTNRKVVTNHDAFGYFLDRYGLTFVGSVIPSFDSTAELSAADVSELVAKIKAEGVVAVFSESSIPPKTAEAIAREAGVKVIGGEDALYGDALGPKGSPGETYVGMMRHNARVIVEGLGGTGPRA